MSIEDKNPFPNEPSIAETLERFDKKTPDEKADDIDHDIGVLTIAEGLHTKNDGLKEVGRSQIRDVADRQVDRIFAPSTAVDTQSRELRQPLPVTPEVTGDTVKDKAHMWLYSASWEAARVSREAAVELAIDKARKNATPRPNLNTIGQPDFMPEDSALLTRIVQHIERPGTQQMLAQLHDMREANAQAQRPDNIRDQMTLLNVVLQNSDLQY